MDDRKLIKCRHGRAIFPCTICEREKEVIELLAKNAELIAYIERVKDCQKRNYGNATALHLEMIVIVNELPSQSLAIIEAGVIQKIVDEGHKKYGHVVDIALHLSELQKMADDMKGS